MKTLRILLVAVLTLAPLAPAVGLDRILSAPQIKGNGDVRLSDDFKIGRFQGGKFISQPDSVQIQGAGSTGPIDEMSVQRESAAKTLTLRKKLGETISVAEYADVSTTPGILGTLNQTQCDALSARAKVEGKSISIPGGSWSASCTLTIDRSDQTGFNPVALRGNISGQGSGTTVWNYTGTGRAFYIRGGGTGSAQEARQAVTGFTLIGPSATADGSIGIGLDHIAWMGLDDMLITNFDKAVDGIDVEYLRAYRTLVRFNKRGVTMDSRVNNTAYTADPTSSDPNSHSWIASTFGNNTEYAAEYKRGNSLSFIGTDIQYNGNGTIGGNNPVALRPGFAVRNTDPGTQGGVGLLIQGGYIEGNGGVADVWLRQKDATFVNTSATTYKIDATGFARSSPTARTSAFIALDFISASGPQSFSATSTAFKNYNGATATGPAIAFIGQKKQGDIEFVMTGSVYSVGEEVDEWMPYTSTVTRPSATSGFAGAVSAVYSRKWRTVKVDGAVFITTTGTGGGSPLNVTMPVPTRARIASCSANDLNGAAPIYAAMVQNSSTLILNVPMADARTVSFHCEYPIN